MPRSRPRLRHAASLGAHDPLSPKTDRLGSNAREWTLMLLATRLILIRRLVQLCRHPRLQRMRTVHQRLLLMFAGFVWACGSPTARPNNGPIGKPEPGPVATAASPDSGVLPDSGAVESHSSDDAGTDSGVVFSAARFCADAGASCGWVSGQYCGDCASESFCGASGKPNQCGAPIHEASVRWVRPNGSGVPGVATNGTQVVIFTEGSVGDLLEDGGTDWVAPSIASGDAFGLTGLGLGGPFINRSGVIAATANNRHCYGPDCDSTDLVEFSDGGWTDVSQGCVSCDEWLAGFDDSGAALEYLVGSVGDQRLAYSTGQFQWTWGMLTDPTGYYPSRIPVTFGAHALSLQGDTVVGLTPDEAFGFAGTTFGSDGGGEPLLLNVGSSGDVPWSRDLQGAAGSVLAISANPDSSWTSVVSASGAFTWAETDFHTTEALNFVLSSSPDGKDLQATTLDSVGAVVAVTTTMAGQTVILGQGPCGFVIEGLNSQGAADWRSEFPLSSCDGYLHLHGMVASPWGDVLVTGDTTVPIDFGATVGSVSGGFLMDLAPGH